MINEFKTKEEIEEKFENIIQITNRIGIIVINTSFEYDGKAHSEIRNIAKNKLLTSYPNQKKGIHIAWSKQRYRELFNLKFRISHKYYNNCAFTLGNPYRTGEQTKMVFIEWKPQYRDVRNCNVPNTTYIYQTTKNTWRVFKI